MAYTPSRHRSETEELHKFSIAVMGSSSVGKSTLIGSFISNAFPDEHVTEMGRLHRLKKQDMDIDIIESKYIHALSMNEQLIALADAFILVYAVDNMASFDYITGLQHHIVDTKGNDVRIVVIGNTKESDDRDVMRKIAECVVTIDWENRYYELSARRDVAKICNIFYDLLCHPGLGKPKCESRAKSVPSPDIPRPDENIVKTTASMRKRMSRSVSLRGFRRVRDFVQSLKK